MTICREGLWAPCSFCQFVTQGCGAKMGAGDTECFFVLISSISCYRFKNVSRLHLVLDGVGVANEGQQWVNKSDTKDLGVLVDFRISPV